MIGQFVSSKAGHDKDTIYVIVGEQGDFVYLSDGRLKAPDHPKKKRRKHVQPTNDMVNPSLREKLETGQVLNKEEILSAIRQYKNSKQ